MASNTLPDFPSPPGRGASTYLAAPSPSPPRTFSLFPPYNHSLPPSRQEYYPRLHPTVHAPPPSASLSPLRNSCYTSLQPSPASKDSPLGELRGLSDSQTIQGLWAAANGTRQCLSRTNVRLAMQSHDAHADKIVFRAADGRPFYSTTIPWAKLFNKDDAGVEILVQRHHPIENTVLPAAQLGMHLSFTSPAGHGDQHAIASIFPQLAALRALEAAANSGQASSIASHDPRASSPQAVQLAFDAVDAAKARDGCQLGYICPGHYELQHARLGALPIHVEGSVNLAASDDSSVAARRASWLSSRGTGKILLFATPRAGRAADNETRPASALVALDTATGVLELDVAALQALGVYMVDAAVGAVVAVAVAESARQLDGSALMRFAAPPGGAEARSTRRPWRRVLRLDVPRKKKEGKKQQSEARREGKGDEKGGQMQGLPAVVRGILHVLGFGFDVALWILELVVKVLTKLVRCVPQA